MKRWYSNWSKSSSIDPPVRRPHEGHEKRGEPIPLGPDPHNHDLLLPAQIVQYQHDNSIVRG